MNNNKICNCKNTPYSNNYLNNYIKTCPNKKLCNNNKSILSSLYCVENFLCSSQKACTLYKFFCFFRRYP